MQKILFILSLLIGTGLGLSSNPVYAQNRDVKNMPNRSPATTSAPGGAIEGRESIDIRGQSRTLSMGLMIQSKKDKLRFVEPRRHYREEILNTNY